MKKSLSLVLVLTVLSVGGYAQTNLDAEVDAELDQMYAAPATQSKVETVTIPAETAQASAGTTTTAPTQTPVAGQPIYILNQATPTATAGSNAEAGAAAVNVQKQPTTVIEASPLTESRAEALRKARQEAEMSTEAKIVEKLEAARLEDERRRAQLLFGNKNLTNEAPAQEQQPAAAPVQPAPQPQIIIVPQPVAPAAPVAPLTPPEEKKEETPAPTAAAVDAEMESAVKAESSLIVEPLAPVAKKYFTGIAGVGEVSGADHVKGNYALGFTFGTKYDDTYAVEGTFMYSNYESENINNQRWYGQYDLFDVNQYSGSVALKYYFLKGMVRPVLGGLAQYSYRDFKWSDKNGTTPYNLGESTSHAFDVGGIAGVEIQFSPTMTLGFDMKYIKNVAVNRNYSTSDLRYQGGAPMTPQQQQDWQYGYRTPIENLDHYIYALSFQVSF